MLKTIYHLFYNSFKPMFNIWGGTGWQPGHPIPGGALGIDPGEEQPGHCSPQQAARVPARVPGCVPALHQGQAPHITSIATDWHFTAALRCCQGLEVSPANKSQALCSITPPFLPVNGPFLSPGNVILHHPITL